MKCKKKMSEYNKIKYLWDISRPNGFKEKFSFHSDRHSWYWKIKEIVFQTETFSNPLI